jgi:hypothetical protein
VLLLVTLQARARGWRARRRWREAVGASIAPQAAVRGQPARGPASASPGPAAVRAPHLPVGPEEVPD